MRQKVDVLAVFNIDCRTPRPLRFKVVEKGLKTTVNISKINNVDFLGAGGVTRIEYDCNTVNENKCIDYKLIYYYRECRWEIEV